ncbi:MAG: hypothetical protein A2Z50_02925, partial [Nitrospirae bacterium RBG_19FT_COMBO_42_15]
PQNIELIDNLFRDAHTLKGSSAMMGFGIISDVAHRAEDILESARSGQVVPDREIINFLFEVLDTIKILLDDISSGRKEDATLRDAINKKSEILNKRQKAEGKSEEALEGRASEEAVADDESIERVYNSLDKIFVDKDGQESDTVDMDAAFKEMGAEEEDAIEDLPVKAEKPVERVAPGRRVADVSDLEKRIIRVQLDQLSNLMNLVGELVVNRNRLTGQLEHVKDIRDELVKSKARLLKVVKDFESKYEFSMSHTSFSSTANKPSGAKESSGHLEGFFELEFDRYDDFNLLSRKLVEITNDMSEIMESLSDFFNKIDEGAVQISKITTSLQQEITSVRMVEIEKLFQRFSRLVRDVSQSENKKVRLEFLGGDTKIDKAVFELISDPLVHIIRNAISHGIEMPHDRKLSGKEDVGVVFVRAYQEGNNVVIEVGDDGRGIDPDLIRVSAVEKGYIAKSEEKALSDEDAINLIFLPGFSTSKQINAISGRGVGMDVVRTNITKMNGQIEVHTEIGLGTKFIIRLPATLAVSQALIIKSMEQEFAVPLSLIDETTRISQREIDYVAGSEVINLRNKIIPFIRLNNILNLDVKKEKSYSSTELYPTLILKLADKKIALMVDEIIAQEEIVVKNMVNYLKDIGLFSGATISGEGNVRFIIDTAALIEDSLLTGKKGVGVRTILKSEDRGSDAAASTVKKRETQLEKPKIIIVDDSISIRKYVSHFLTRAGYEVEVASDGFEALNKIGQIKVDLIVTDLEMPVMHGYELIAELKRVPDLSKIPIIVLTSRAGEKHRQKAFEMGAQEYVVKPFEEDVLIDSIKKLLK